MTDLKRSQGACLKKPNSFWKGWTQQADFPVQSKAFSCTVQACLCLRAPVVSQGPSRANRFTAKWEPQVFISRTLLSQLLSLLSKGNWVRASVFFLTFFPPLWVKSLEQNSLCPQQATLWGPWGLVKSVPYIPDEFPSVSAKFRYPWKYCKEACSIVKDCSFFSNDFIFGEEGGWFSGVSSLIPLYESQRQTWDLQVGRRGSTFTWGVISSTDTEQVFLEERAFQMTVCWPEQTSPPSSSVFAPTLLPPSLPQSLATAGQLVEKGVIPLVYYRNVCPSVLE